MYHRSSNLLASFSLAAVVLLAATSAAHAAGSKPKTEPGEAYKVYNEGVDLMLKGDFPAAAQKFEQALKTKKDFPEAHNNLGYSLRKQGKEHYAQALEHYNQALELNPKLAEAYMYRGVLFVLMGDEEKAKADHAKLVDLDRELAEALMQVLATGKEPEGNAGVSKRWKQL